MALKRGCAGLQVLRAGPPAKVFLQGFRVYLDPKSMYNNGPYGYYYGFRAIVFHSLGVQVVHRGSMLHSGLRDGTSLLVIICARKTISPPCKLLLKPMKQDRYC